MKKKLLVLLLIPVLLVLTTACNKATNNNGKDKKITKTIELSDSKLGFTTTFKYDADDKYTNLKESSGGASKEITFENKDLDIEVQMYYTKMRSATYNSTEQTRSAQKYYKEYTFGDYEAYAYGEYSSGINLNILLGIDEDDNAEVLFVAIDRLDSNEDVVIADVLADEKLQSFFNSMEFVKE